MNNLFSGNNDINTFRPPWWYSTFLLLLSFIMIFLLSIPILIFGPLLFAYIAKNGINAYVLLGFLILLPFLLLVLVMSIYHISISITSFFSYIRTSPEGIEYKYWPFAYIRGKWQDVDKINVTSHTGKFILFNQYELLGLSISFLGFFKKLRKTEQGMIPIRENYCSKNAILLDEVKKYAPHAFNLEIQNSTSNGKQQEIIKEVPANHFNTDQLLVCLSHGSIFARLPGIIVPILVLFTKGKKNQEIKYQSTQAVIWQLFSAIMKGIVYTVFIAGSSLIFHYITEARLFSDPTNLIVGFIIITLIIIIATDILFGIFPVIGIVKIFQEKEFQYPFIGKAIRN